MGNTSTKLAEKCALLSKEEVPIVAGSFKFVSKNSDRIKEDDLMVKLFDFNCFSNFNKKKPFYFLEILGISNGSSPRTIYYKFSVWFT